MMLFRFFTERSLRDFHSSVLRLASYLSRLRCLASRPLIVWTEPYLGRPKREVLGGAAIPEAIERVEDSFGIWSRATESRDAFDFLFRFESENPGSIYYKNKIAKKLGSTHFGAGHGSRLDLALSEEDAAGLSKGEVAELLEILQEIFETSGAVYGYGTRCDPLVVQTGRSAEEISSGALAEIFEDVWYKLLQKRSSGSFCLNYLGPALLAQVEADQRLATSAVKLASGGTVLSEGWSCLLKGEPSPLLRELLAALRPKRYEKGFAPIPNGLSLLLSEGELAELGGEGFVQRWFPADRIERVAGRWWHLKKESRSVADSLLEREVLWPLRPGRSVDWRLDLPDLRLGFVDRYFSWNQPDALRVWFDLPKGASEIELRVDLYRRPSTRTLTKLEALLAAHGFEQLEALEKRYRYLRTREGETADWLQLLSCLEDFGCGTAPLIVAVAPPNSEQAWLWAAMTREARLFTQF